MFIINSYVFQAVLLVYDITNQSSFDNLEDWYETVKTVCEKNGTKLPHMALVANKSKHPLLPKNILLSLFVLDLYVPRNSSFCYALWFATHINKNGYSDIYAVVSLCYSYANKTVIGCFYKRIYCAVVGKLT